MAVRAAKLITRVPAVPCTCQAFKSRLPGRFMQALERLVSGERAGNRFLFWHKATCRFLSYETPVFEMVQEFRAIRFVREDAFTIEHVGPEQMLNTTILIAEFDFTLTGAEIFTRRLFDQAYAV